MPGRVHAPGTARRVAVGAVDPRHRERRDAVVPTVADVHGPVDRIQHDGAPASERVWVLLDCTAVGVLFDCTTVLQWVVVLF